MGHVGRMGPVGVAVCLAGCCCFFPFQGDPFYDEYTRTEPDRADVVGVWQANGFTVDWLRDQGYVLDGLPQLELRDDGTFTMTAMPDCWRIFFPSDRKKVLESGSGTWRVEKVQEWYALEMDFDRLNGETWTSTFSNVFHLCRQQPPYMVHITVGDPDSGDCLELERVPAAAPAPTQKVSK